MFAIIDYKAFADAFRKVRRAVDTESTRYALGMVRVEFADNELILVATDGRRLHVATLPAETSEEGAGLLDPGTVAEFAKLKPAGKIAVRLNEIGDVQLCCAEGTAANCGAGRFPRWRDVMPDAPEYDDNFACAKRKHWAPLFERVGEPGRDLFANGKAPETKQTVRQNVCRVASGDAITRGKIEVTLSPQFARDALAMFGASQRVAIHTKAPDEPVIVRSPDAPQFRAIIMPMSN